MTTSGSEDRQPAAVRESLAIPDSVRKIVDERDKGFCRMCGKFLGLEDRAIHHIIFGGDARGFGGRRVHNPDEMVTLCWMWAGNCHDRAHGDKHRWQELLLQVVQRKGVTAFQLERWSKRRMSTQRPLGGHDG